MSSENEQGNCQEEFNGLVNDLKKDVLSLELTDFENETMKYNTKGTTENNYKEIQELISQSCSRSGKSIVYDNFKYMFLKNIINEDGSTVYVFISTEPDSNGMKKGMFIASFFSYGFIATFEHKKINSATAKILSVIDQYQPEE